MSDAGEVDASTPSDVSGNRRPLAKAVEGSVEFRPGRHSNVGDKVDRRAPRWAGVRARQSHRLAHRVDRGPDLTSSGVDAARSAGTWHTSPRGHQLARAPRRRTASPDRGRRPLAAPPNSEQLVSTPFAVRPGTPGAQNEHRKLPVPAPVATSTSDPLRDPTASGRSRSRGDLSFGLDATAATPRLLAGARTAAKSAAPERSPPGLDRRRSAGSRPGLGPVRSPAAVGSPARAREATRRRRCSTRPWTTVDPSPSTAIPTGIRLTEPRLSDPPPAAATRAGRRGRRRIKDRHRADEPSAPARATSGCGAGYRTQGAARADRRGQQVAVASSPASS